MGLDTPQIKFEKCDRRRQAVRQGFHGWAAQGKVMQLDCMFRLEVDRPWQANCIPKIPVGSDA